MHWVFWLHTNSLLTCLLFLLSPFTALHFELGGTTYLNNTVVLVDDIGEEGNALLCVTSKQDCCTTDRRGEFYYPNGVLVPTNGRGQDFYRNRGDGFIRLNRRNGATSPTGRYRCEIPDAAGNLQNIVIEVGELLFATLAIIAPVYWSFRLNVSIMPISTNTAAMSILSSSSDLPHYSATNRVSTANLSPTPPTVTCPDCPDATCPTAASCNECPSTPTARKHRDSQQEHSLASYLQHCTLNWEAPLTWTTL